MNWRNLAIHGLLRASGSRIPENLEEMRRVSQLAAPQVQEYQRNRLQDTLKHAAQHVPYYRRVLTEAGVVDQGQVRLEHFHRIPLLTKDIIRREGASLHAPDHEQRGSYENTSGGSTGVPVRFLQDKAYDAMNTATKIFLFERLGKQLGEAEIKLWGSDRDILAGNLTAKDRAINFLYNRRFFNCYDFTREHMLRLVTLNNTFRPCSYWTYVDAAFEFAKFVNREGIQLTPPKVIVATIGPLYPDQKAVMEQAFGCTVSNQYGSREVGVICAHAPEGDDMQVFFWRSFLEILPVENSDTPDEGRILLTTLDNDSMPLIRYDIGDVALKGAQSYTFGETTSYLSVQNVVGRTLGFFRMPDGTLKHTHFIVQQLFFKDWIARFQVAQEEYGRAVIRVVLAGEKNPADMDDIVAKSKVLLGEDFQIDFEFVDEIPASASGKVLYTVCNVPDPEAGGS